MTAWGHVSGGPTSSWLVGGPGWLSFLSAGTSPSLGPWLAEQGPPEEDRPCVDTTWGSQRERESDPREREEGVGPGEGRADALPATAPLSPAHLGPDLAQHLPSPSLVTCSLSWLDSTRCGQGARLGYRVSSPAPKKAGVDRPCALSSTPALQELREGKTRL